MTQYILMTIIILAALIVSYYVGYKAGEASMAKECAAMIIQSLGEMDDAGEQDESGSRNNMTLNEEMEKNGRNFKLGN